MGFKRRIPRSYIGLADEWRHWIADALIAGASAETIASELEERGVSPAIAVREIDVIATVVRRARRDRERLALAARLLRAVSAPEVERRRLCSADEFYARYFGPSRPVVFEDGCQFRAVGTWTPEWLAQNFGDIEVQVSAGRDADPEHYIDPTKDAHTVNVAELVSRIRAAGRSNDVYLVSRNRAFEQPLAGLVDWVRPLPEFLQSRRLHERASLWFGPAGTHTPLHHDTTNVYFCQIYGRKRIRLVPMLEPRVLLGSIHGTFYSELPATDKRLAAAEFELAPGEAVFIPAGWWHEVDALEVSISVSITAFARPNRFDWYRPGDA